MKYFDVLQVQYSVPSDDLILCNSLKEYVLSEEKLIENNYPVRHPEKPGCAIRFVDSKKGTGDRELMSLGLAYFEPCYHISLVDNGACFVGQSSQEDLLSLRGYLLCESNRQTHP